MKTWLFNPFKFIAGNKAMAVGLGAMAITAIVCFLKKLHLDGIIDLHLGKETPGYLYFAEPVIDWLSLVLPLYIFARILSASKVRFIDVAGTSALARYPMFFAVITSLLLPQHITDPQSFLNSLQTDPNLMVRLVVLSLLIIPIIVWTVALMYNAYTISANLKGPKAAWSFIASFVMSEILAKFIISAMV